MKRNLLTVACVCLAVSCGLLVSTVTAQPAGPTAGGKEPDLAFQYDFAVVEDGRTSDASGNDHDGQIVEAKIVEGRLKNAVEFGGRGAVRMTGVPATIDPKSHALTVGAFCRPAALDGVLLAMGDSTDGFSLYLKAGVPRFAVRTGGQLFTAAACEPVVADQWVHLAGVINADGTLRLVVNGWPTASAPGRLIADTPSEPFAVGADEGLPVGDYAAPLHWTGLVQDVRLYWGYLDRTEGLYAWQTWADLPGCACRKGAAAGGSY
ncbi:MAG: LamG domain-containing protein [Candidatus Latescibacterota bacterium]|jgi:hypothetical protein